MKPYLLILLAIALVGIGSVHAVTVVNVTIAPSTAYFNDTLIGYCNATANTTNLSYNVQWFRNNTAISTYTWGRTCYQESANESTPCGGLSTGGYGVSAETYALLINYTRPVNATAVAWKYSVASTNYTVAVPDDCFTSATGKVQFNISGSSTGATLNFVGSCANDTAWKELWTGSGGWSTAAVGYYSTSDCFDGNYSNDCGRRSQDTSWFQTTGVGVPASVLSGLNDEAVLWTMNMTLPSNLTSIVGALTNGKKAESYVLSCQANDTNGVLSSWLNSSAVQISNTAPVNNWGSNPQSLHHNTSTMFGGFCSDADVFDTIVYSTNNMFFPILANGSINWTANVSRSGNYTVNISCSDGTANSTATVLINVTNTLPNVTSAALTPLPAQAGNALNLTYSCTDADGDTCNVSVFYAWFKNGVLNSTITGASFGGGNFTIGDNITGSVRVYDGQSNSSWRNTTTATVGDTTFPALTAFTVSPASTTTAGSVTISANCTDNNEIDSVLAEVTDALSVKANFSMTNTSSAYSYVYAPPIAGTYSARVFCTDGNGNVNVTTSSVFTVTAASSGGGGGGGGGGGTTVVVGGDCEFSIVRPTNGFVNTLCRAGERSANLSFVLMNQEATTVSFSTSFSGVQCTIDESSFSVSGKAQHGGTISDCVCPTNVSIEGNLEITATGTAGVCTGELPIKLYNGVLSRALFDQTFLVKLVFVFFLAVIVLAGIYIGTR